MKKSEMEREMDRRYETKIAGKYKRVKYAIISDLKLDRTLLRLSSLELELENFESNGDEPIEHTLYKYITRNHLLKWDDQFVYELIKYVFEKYDEYLFPNDIYLTNDKKFGW